MKDVERALAAVESRKQAVFGGDGTGPPQTVVATPFQQAALLGGFDIDMDQLEEISARAAAFFCDMSITAGLLPLFQGAWTDGLLVGLLLGQQSDDD